MKKIGLICLAVVLALGALGVGFAAWTDTLYIDGTVNTGSVDLDIVKLSSTYVYKDLDTDECVVVYEITDEDGNVIHTFGTEPTNSLLVASAVATNTSTEGRNEVTFTYDNLFPCEYFVCDVMFHYTGSIPAKVNDISWTITAQDPAGWLDTLEANYDVVGHARIWDNVNHVVTDIVVEEGYQLEDCDYVWICLLIHLPQDAPMNATGSATGTIEVVQWNEYPY